MSFKYNVKSTSTNIYLWKGTKYLSYKELSKAMGISLETCYNWTRYRKDHEGNIIRVLKKVK
jgi:hypothetical protein